MLRTALLVAVVASASAFAPTAVPTLRTGASVCQMQAEGASSRRDFLKIAALGALAAPLAANADVEYPNVPFLGGSDVIDVNNANIRVYTRFPGMYPNIARKIVKKSPYKDINEVFEKCSFTEDEKKIVTKYLDNLTALEPAPEYVIDNINNGLYR